MFAIHGGFKIFIHFHKNIALLPFNRINTCAK